MKSFEITTPMGREPRLDDIRKVAAEVLHLRRNAIINVILGGHVDDDILRQLDFNQDGEISIADVNAVVKIILES
jgi:hypothetical protein